MPTLRYQLTIAYDGTHFCGWQKQEPFAQDALAHQAKANARDPDKQPVRARSSDAMVHASAPPRIVQELPIRAGEDRPRVALRSVQHVVEQAVREVVREHVVLDGASRTDAGVHALGQCGAFSCGDGIAPDGSPTHTGWPSARGTEPLVRALNAKLSPDVLVLCARLVDASFDPVMDATSKAYAYTLHVAKIRPLFTRDVATWVYDELDIGLMQRAAQHLVGTHDFVSFAALHHGRATTIRTIFDCRVRELHDETPASVLGAGAAEASANHAPAARRVVIEVSGSGFLYNMVRIIAGTLVEVGKGRMHPDDIPAILAAKDRRRAGTTMPPQGLCLQWIKYANHS